jgi:hypothetical protein
LGLRASRTVFYSSGCFYPGIAHYSRPPGDGKQAADGWKKAGNVYFRDWNPRGVAHSCEFRKIVWRIVLVSFDRFSREPVRQRACRLATRREFCGTLSLPGKLQFLASPAR